MNALQLVADGFHTKKRCSRLSSSEVRFLSSSPLLAWSLGATYDDHPRLTGMRVVDFLLKC